MYRAVEGLVNLHFALTVPHPVEADHANNLLVKDEAVFNHDLLKNTNERGYAQFKGYIVKLIKLIETIKFCCSEKSRIRCITL